MALGLAVAVMGSRVRLTATPPPLISPPRAEFSSRRRMGCLLCTGRDRLAPGTEASSAKLPGASLSSDTVKESPRASSARRKATLSRPSQEAKTVRAQLCPAAY